MANKCLKRDVGVDGLFLAQFDSRDRIIGNTEDRANQLGIRDGKRRSRGTGKATKFYRALDDPAVKRRPKCSVIQGCFRFGNRSLGASKSGLGTVVLRLCLVVFRFGCTLR